MSISYQKTESSQLEAMLPHIDLLADSVSPDALGKIPGSRDVIVSRPTPDFLFLHEAAVIGYHGILFASWYNCAVGELYGYTPIRGAKSFDGGKTGLSPRSLPPIRPENCSTVRPFTASAAIRSICSATPW